MSQEDYFQRLESELDNAWEVAESARDGSDDPEEEVEIKRAKDMAERTEMFLEIDGLADEIRQLQEEGYDREAISFELTESFLEGELGDFEEQEKKIEYAIRSALCVLTEAVVAAPLEGLISVTTESENPDGSEYIRVKYGGPIRSAGGTGQVISVLIADYCRQELGIGEFKPTDDEVERYVEEISLYHNTHRNLQYFPSDDESRTIVRNTPIMVDAEPVTDQEVSGYRDLDRIDTNAGRGGMCLVMAEGIAQKVPKLQKYTDELGLDGWEWLNDLPTASKIDDEEEEDEEDEEDNEEENEEGDDHKKETKHGRAKVKPKTKYIDDTLTAGRPIIGHPSRPGGFRLRYGRSRNAGMAAGSISPATMTALYDYIGPGTQLKTERPGKAIAAAPDDSLQGPTVRLEDGTVTRIDTEERARELRDNIEKFLDLGEIGMPFGEFVENNAQLVPASFTHDWWVKEAERAGFDPGNLTPDKLNARQAWNIAEKHDIPLHPKYTYLWHDIGLQDYVALCNAIDQGEKTEDGGLVIPDNPVETVEALLVPHKQNQEDETIEFTREHAYILENCSDPSAVSDAEHIMEAVNQAADVEIRERAPTRIGTRMGRPEKAEKRTFQRNLNSHVLFPVGEEVQRSVVDAASLSNSESQMLNGERKNERDPDSPDLGKGDVEVELSTRICPDCQEETYHPTCPDCEVRTKVYADCPKCRNRVTMETEDMGQKDCPECGREGLTANKEKVVNVGEELQRALDKLGVRRSQIDDITGVEGLVSQEKVPEAMEKGVLRAKYDLGIFKDGTSRFDATNLPLTAFKPEEINVSVEQIRELGYETDIHGEPLEEPDQLVELKQQDVVLPKEGAEYMLREANFIDELLENYYDEEPFYNLDDMSDLAGELIIGLAPHTSAGALGRIIGYVEGVQAQYAHPIFYGAKRRNCFHPDETLYYQVEHENGDTEWNYGTIQELVETYIDSDNLETDDVGSEYSDPIKTVRVPSITENGQQVLKELNKVQRNPAPDHMVTFETETGREITVTPDHGMLVYENGEQKKVPASEVQEGDKFLEPTHLDTIDGNNTQQFDLLKELSETKEVDNDKLTIANLTEQEVKQLYEQAFGVNTDNGYLAELRDRLNKSKKTISNYVYRGNIPVSFLLRGFENVEELCKATPDNAHLGWKRNDVTANRFVELDEKLATFLGYYAAEGFTRDQDSGVFQTTISATEDEAREFALKAFYDCFGVEAYKQNEHKITASSAIVQQAMKHVFDAEDHSHKKKVPECIMTTSDKDLIGSFLGGYISGDGSIGKSVKIGVTVSPELKTGLCDLLRRLDITASVSTRSPKDLHEKFPDYYEPGEKESRKTYNIRIPDTDVEKLAQYCEIQLSRKQEKLQEIVVRDSRIGKSREIQGDNTVTNISSKEYVETEASKTYNIEVSDTNKVIITTSNYQCDSDEDAFMLLMDGLLNYSEHYLNHNKSGKFMDEPVVMNSIIDPSEIDDEAHNVDVIEEYPLELYEASMEGVGPDEVDIEILEDRLDDPTGVKHSLETESITGGPKMTVYKTLPDMDAKIDTQFKISRQVRATVEEEVAEKVIDGHFLADLMGNLRAFGTQEVRCTSCHYNHNRPPLDGKCRKCGDTNSWTLNVHEGSVTKYLENMKEMSEEYEVSNYIQEVIDEYDRAIESLFENDKDKQADLSEFL